jgi:hypothetical protein
LGSLPSDGSDHSLSLLGCSYLSVVIADCFDVPVNILGGDRLDGLNGLEYHWLYIADSQLISLKALYDSDLLVALV